MRLDSPSTAWSLLFDDRAQVRDYARRFVHCDPCLGPIAHHCKGTDMSLSLIVIILLVLLLIGALPTWGYSRSWGYRPMGGLGVILVIIIVLMLLHVI